MYVDGHLDIAYNVIAAGRDVTRSVAETRAAEGGPHPLMGSCTVSLPDLALGGVGLVFGTLFTLPATAQSTDLPAEQSYHNADEAYNQALAQLVVYQGLAAAGQLRLVRSQADLAAHRAAWEAGDRTLGMVLLMENGDPIREPAEASWWYGQGVRIVGPAWQATRYCGGTRAPGPLTDLGRALMPALAEAGFILDISHMAEESFWQALDLFNGPVIASHSNCRALVSAVRADRHLSDTMIRALLKRDAVIGMVLYNAFLAAEYVLNDPKEHYGLDRLLRHVDHICQIAGNTRHVAIGSDLDGGLGREHIPREIDSVADMSRIAEALSAAGYTDTDVIAMMGGNWIRILEFALPS
ncbi:MAG: peptidase M19 [Oscillochloris sp.]|nr:peptidase M19 [Oscillochloris sp.]